MSFLLKLFKWNKTKTVEKVDIGRQTIRILYDKANGRSVEMDVVGDYTLLSGDDVYVKKASAKEALEKAYERGFLHIYAHGGEYTCIPVSEIYYATIGPMLENIVEVEV